MRQNPEKTPSSKHQTPEKLQTSNFKTAGPVFAADYADYADYANKISA
jgi:hypothetical protein